MTISATESIGVSFWATEFLGGIGLYGLDGLFLLTDFTDYLFWASVFKDFLFWHWTLRTFSSGIGLYGLSICPRLIEFFVPLTFVERLRVGERAREWVLSLDNKNKKAVFCFVLCSLIRTFELRS